MKIAWSALVAGLGIVVASTTYMWDISVLLLGVLGVAGGLTALFLNAKRLEALAEASGTSENDDGCMEAA
mgnify:CR=1 FL=1